jgi:hypothetical protein
VAAADVRDGDPVIGRVEAGEGVRWADA